MGRYVVTGGVGFIGYHVTRALLARGASVRVIDDFSDAPYPRRLKERNAQDLVDFADDDMLAVDRVCVTDAARVAELVEGADAVLHLGGLAGVRPSFADPVRYTRVNVDGTASLVEAAIRAKVPRLVIASSSSVYGNSTPLPAREDAPAIEPESPYAASKRGAELLALATVKKAPRLACCALRFFTVYGPRQRPEMAITLFARAILEGRPITVFGDGSMKRDFTHVDDIAAGVLAALDRAPVGFRVYNLGSGAPVTLGGLVSALGRAAGREPVIERAPVPLGDVDATFADITRAREELGWSPKVSLDDGIASVIRWVRDNP
jgi:UDP-glucuronate 4-epimerase